MKERASCKHLTHKFPAYYGCTLGEVFIIACTYMTADIMLAGILSVFWGKFFLFLIGVFVASLVLIRATANRIGRLKEGRQQGYVSLKFKHWLNKNFQYPVPFINRSGKWITRRRLWV